MAIKEEKVWITLTSSNYKHWENSGYLIIRTKDKKGRMRIPRGTKIEVKVSDLQNGSMVKLTKICDICGVESNNKQNYKDIVKCRKLVDGLDRCIECGLIHGASYRINNVPHNKTISHWAPHLISEWHPTLNGDRNPFNVSHASNEHFWWKCPDCGRDYQATAGSRVCLESECNYCVRKRGEDHHLYNPNISKEEREIKRQYPEYLEWRAAVYKRDKYTCQCCGQLRGDINAHHLDGYAWCIERRTDVSNGVTLCKKCHLDFHIMFGNKNNTEEQYKEWIYQKNELINLNINIAM